ncbi:MAG: hypothetical protein KatS3mg002_0902 [Candidatus Woesearchaeota archaeon]|nr:MAG: hypothetical protein KatS3mg002_0902 [Candidatus Woesearchaeota archaeon]
MEWTKIEKKFFISLNSPSKIQDYLDAIDYDVREGSSSPRYVINEGKANCFEGALLAAAALENIGYKPLIIDMIAHNDDDHVIAVYKKNNRWGALGKSNTTVLKYREPVYNNIRELIMSYFDFYLNINGEKTLREYSSPVNLKIFDNRKWRTTSEDLEFISDYLYKIKHHKIIKKSMIKHLRKADPLLLEATLLGSLKEGLYKPE